MLIVVAAVAALGGTATGALINQRGAARQATTAWNRERQRDHEQQAREERARTFEQRTTAYVELIQSLQRADQAIHAAMRQGADTLVEAYHADVQKMMAAVQIFGSGEVAALGWKAWKRVLIFEVSLGLGEPSGIDQSRTDNEALGTAIKNLIAAVRADLGIEPPPDGGPPTLPPS